MFVLSPSFSSQHKLFLLFILISCSIFSAKAKHHLHKWDIEYQFKSPDCHQKLALTINGETPGPTISAKQGDTIIIRMKNKLLTENVAMHWHGIRQIGTPWSDGTEGVTQCATLPADTFEYKFVVDRAGTYIYHAHYGMQRSAGLNGMIVVAEPDGVSAPFSYDSEANIVLNDWWHTSTYEEATGLLSVPFGWVGEPQALLINGRGKFDCSLAGANAVCNASNPECLPYVLTVEKGKTYRLRIASITSLSAFNFEIEGHEMTVVETDGHYVKPFVVKNLNIYSGETYSVLIKADQDPSRNYWMGLNVVSRKPGTPTGVAILNYSPNNPFKKPPTSPPTGPLWSDLDYRLAQSIATKAHPKYAQTPPKKSDKTIILLNTQNKLNGQTKWAINNVSFFLPETPYLIALKHNISGAFDTTPPPETYDYKNYDINVVQPNPNTTTSNGLYRLKFNSVVDVILQNSNTLSLNSSETHPWHLHGHDFWVLGYGTGKFDPEVHSKEYNLVDPIMKNTVALHPNGWTAIRFRANNPGVWAFHCHIESHFFMGMGVVFEEGVERVGKLPTSIMGCGKTKHLLKP